MRVRISLLLGDEITLPMWTTLLPLKSGLVGGCQHALDYWAVINLEFNECKTLKYVH